MIISDYGESADFTSMIFEYGNGEIVNVGKVLAHARWLEVNPVLKQGEPGFEYDEKRLKIGDGKMLNIGDRAPNFTLKDKHGNDVRLSDFIGKRIVLYFYPKDNTPGCTRQACAFAGAYAEFQRRGVEVIGINSFCHNESLERIDFSSMNLAEINTIANDNDNLETVCISSSVSTISNSFNECPKLVNIYVTSVDVPTLSNSFDSLPTNAKIYVPAESYLNYISADGWRDLKDYIDYFDSNIITYTATSKIEPYRTDVFGANIVSNNWDKTTGVGTIIFDGEITEIGYYAFHSCNNLTDVVIPNSVTVIGGASFAFCSGLTSINIPDSVVTIDTAAFSHCANLTSVTVSNNISSIGLQAFVECDALSEFYCKAVTPPDFNWMAFYMIDSNFVIYVPTESIDAYKTAAGWSDYADRIVGYNFGE